MPNHRRSTQLAGESAPRPDCLHLYGWSAGQEENLLSQLGILEQGLSDLLPITFLRPAWYMENAVWDLKPARDTGVIQSFLQPLDKATPMVATADVGRVAAELLQEQWQGHRVVELEGPSRISPDDIAASFARLLNRSVRASIVPRNTWEALFRSQRMKNPTPRIRMLDGFNEGWLAFEHDTRKGRGTRHSAAHSHRSRPMSTATDPLPRLLAGRSFSLSPSASGGDATGVQLVVAPQ